MTAAELLNEHRVRESRKHVRIYFAGSVAAWLRHKREQYWTTHRRSPRDPLWDLEYLDIFLQLPRT